MLMVKKIFEWALVIELIVLRLILLVLLLYGAYRVATDLMKFV